MPSDRTTVDVAIIGGGVAGSALAINLRRHGIDVAVIERERRFRDRVRGDALFPWGVAEAAKLGIADLLPVSGARPLPIWQTYEHREPREPYDWRRDVPTGDVAWGIDHPRLQEAMLARAAELGAKIHRPAKATRAIGDATDGFEVALATDAGDRRVHCRLLVGADGSASSVRRWMGARMHRDPVHHVLGGCLIEEVALDPDATHVARFAGGMALIFHRANGRARAYLVLQPEQASAMRGARAREGFLAVCAAAFPEGTLAHARAVGPAAFFSAIDIWSDRIVSDGVVLIGDAAGANDPAQGQGLSLALRDVRELSALLYQEREWQHAIDEFGRRRAAWYEPLRAYARWQGPLTTEPGAEADAARARARRAADLDPWRGGYGAIHALGPEGLPTSEEARRHYLGLDLADFG